MQMNIYLSSGVAMKRLGWLFFKNYTISIFQVFYNV